jgi:hypothetical protein
VGVGVVHLFEPHSNSGSGSGSTSENEIEREEGDDDGGGLSEFLADAILKRPESMRLPRSASARKGSGSFIRAGAPSSAESHSTASGLGLGSAGAGSVNTNGFWNGFGGHGATTAKDLTSAVDNRDDDEDNREIGDEEEFVFPSLTEMGHVVRTGQGSAGASHPSSPPLPTPHLSALSQLSSSSPSKNVVAEELSAESRRVNRRR